MSTITEVKAKISKASLISASIAFPPDGTQQLASKNRTTVHWVMNTPTFSWLARSGDAAPLLARIVEAIQQRDELVIQMAQYSLDLCMRHEQLLPLVDAATTGYLPAARLKIAAIS
jgi:hypothetical protein